VANGLRLAIHEILLVLLEFFLYCRSVVLGVIIYKNRFTVKILFKLSNRFKKSGFPFCLRLCLWLACHWNFRVSAFNVQDPIFQSSKIKPSELGNWRWNYVTYKSKSYLRDFQWQSLSFSSFLLCANWPPDFPQRIAFNYRPLN